MQRYTKPLGCHWDLGIADIVEELPLTIDEAIQNQPREESVDVLLRICCDLRILAKSYED